MVYSEQNKVGRGRSDMVLEVLLNFLVFMLRIIGNPNGVNENNDNLIPNTS